jgi:hypothetical protein
MIFRKRERIIAKIFVLAESRVATHARQYKRGAKEL